MKLALLVIGTPCLLLVALFVALFASVYGVRSDGSSANKAAIERTAEIVQTR